VYEWCSVVQDSESNAIIDITFKFQCATIREEIQLPMSRHNAIKIYVGHGGKEIHISDLSSTWG